MNTFQTSRLPLAAYLLATKSLELLKCQPISVGKTSFIFVDPNDLGADIELAFDSGAACPIRDYVAAHRALYKKITSGKREGGNANQ